MSDLQALPHPAATHRARDARTRQWYQLRIVAEYYTGMFVEVENAWTAERTMAVRSALVPLDPPR